MKLTLGCPRAHYGADMAIYCGDGQPCAHQYYKRCKGWWVQTDGAKTCPMRKEQSNGTTDQAAADSSDAV